jgi:hypothetical protein
MRSRTAVPSRRHIEERIELALAAFHFDSDQKIADGCTVVSLSLLCSLCVLEEVIVGYHPRRAVWPQSRGISARRFG